ncbi:MAG: acyltransferase [Candidatus Melainabacteria bacterium]|nr:acyltransferase [Candidatus Melainabacteria bacterium]
MQTVQQLPTQTIPPEVPKDASAGEIKAPVQKVILPLTGLRFFPLMAIVWHHSRDRFTFMHGFADDVTFVHGVAFFFVLSGFMLAYRYDYVKDVGTSLHFFLARTARLWPMHVMCIMLLLFLIPEVFKVKGEQVPIFFCNLFLLHSWVPLYSYFFSFNGPSWSSATLSFFDFAFPLIFLTAKRSWALVLGITASFVVVMITICNLMHLPMADPMSPSVHGLVYINPLARLLEFTGGVIAALAFLKYKSHYKLGPVKSTVLEAGILGLVLYIIFNSHHWQSVLTPFLTEPGAFWIHNSGSIFIPCALLIMLIATESGRIAKFLGTKGMVELGEMSFALYMLHGVFIAYFTVNFHDETSPTNAFFFFASLLIAAHLFHNYIVQPIRKQVLKHGTTLLARKWPAPPRKPSTKKPKTKEKIIRERLIFATEVAVFAVVTYFAMPTIEQITPVQAEAIAAAAEVRDINFQPWLECKSVSATSSGNKVNVNTVWKSLSDQSVDYYVTMLVHDKGGAVLGFASYKLDGRHQKISQGTIWSDKVAINVSSEYAANVSIKLTQGRKRKLVEPAASAATSPTKDTIVVPVVPQIACK